MEAIFFTLKSLSMMALWATAEGGAPKGVEGRPSFEGLRRVIDKLLRVKHAPPCKTMDRLRPFQP
jgi:hypothetical protein